MKQLRTGVLTAAIILGLGVAALAQTPLVDRRQRAQQERIQQGRRSGELTYRETARLRAEQRVIRGYERRAESDGIVTCRERRRLDNLLDRSSRDIRRQKHDRQDRN